MKKETKKFLKKRRINASLPVVVKFKKIDGSFSNVNATKRHYILKWEDVLKAFRIEGEKLK